MRPISHFCSCVSNLMYFTYFGLSVSKINTNLKELRGLKEKNSELKRKEQKIYDKYKKIKSCSG